MFMESSWREKCEPNEWVYSHTCALGDNPDRGSPKILLQKNMDLSPQCENLLPVCVSAATNYQS